MSRKSFCFVEFAYIVCERPQQQHQPRKITTIALSYVPISIHFCEGILHRRFFNVVASYCSDDVTISVRRFLHSVFFVYNWDLIMQTVFRHFAKNRGILLRKSLTKCHDFLQNVKKTVKILKFQLWKKQCLLFFLTDRNPPICTF